MAHSALTIVVKAIILLLVSTEALSAATGAQPPPAAAAVPFFSGGSAPDFVPPELRPWIPWVLQGEPEVACPFADHQSPSVRECLFPGRLRVRLVSERSAEFFYEVKVAKENMLVVLPGSNDAWPQLVKVDGKPAIVVESEGKPATPLTRGNHRIAGSFKWSKLLPFLPLPPRIALVSLDRYGELIPTPAVDANGLHLAASPDETQTGSFGGNAKGNTNSDRGNALASSGFDLKVYRKLSDGVPLVLETRLQLKVSKQDGDAKLGPILPDGFLPMSLSGTLPAQLMADGKLLLRLHPGNWSITLLARHDGPVTEIKTRNLAKEDFPVANEEWVFAPDTMFRVVNVEGVPAIDPSQTELPQEWKEFPTYRVAPGAVLTLRESQRGVPAGQERLFLTRTAWLDFSGNGFTFADVVHSDIKGAWRLTARDELKLGRASVNNRDELITRRNEKDSHAGIEIRRQRAEVRADIRYESAAGRFFGFIPTSFPVSGWNREAEQVSIDFRLLPGWRVLGSWGTDFMSNTWLGSWTLEDLFFLLIISLSVARLTTPGCSVLAFLAMALIIPERNIPSWLWLNAIIAVALVKFIQVENIQRFFRLYRQASLLVLAVFVLVVSGVEIRKAVYLPLAVNGSEGAWQSSADHSNDDTSAGVAWESLRLRQAAPEEQDAAPSASTEEAAEPENDTEEGANAEGDGDRNAEMEYEAVESAEAAAIAPSAAAGAKEADVASASDDVVTHGSLAQEAVDEPLQDDRAPVQTGPGVPTWRFALASAKWTGPISAEQTFKVWFLPPATNRILCVARALLALALFVVLAGKTFQGHLLAGWQRCQSRFRDGGALWRSLFLPLLFALGSLGYPERAQAAFPLAELKQRLTKPPACLPHCSLIARSQLLLASNGVSIRLEIHTAENVVVPLPWGADGWRPMGVSANGKETTDLQAMSDGSLGILLPKGIHDILMFGPMPMTPSLALTFPVQPKAVSVVGEGWVAEGIQEGKLVGTSLVLRRMGEAISSKEPSVKGAGPQLFPPLLRVERTLILQSSWRVETRVRRITPPGTPISARIPLLPGEAPTTPNLTSNGQSVSVTLDRLENEVKWSSFLSRSDEIKLTAPESENWVETWRLVAGSSWHVELAGLNPIELAPDLGLFAPVWAPWPGESVTVAVSAPEAVSGQTLTVQTANLTITPGERVTEGKLVIAFSSSKGGQHPVKLPSGIKLTSVTIQNVAFPGKLDGDTLAIPIRPGKQQVEMKWNQEGGVSPFVRTPVVDLGLPAVNIHLNVDMPEGRWILLTGGPSMGPMVLFWGTFAVVLLLAALLAGFTNTPLRMGTWILLGAGLIQVNIAAFLVVAGLFVFLSFRDRYSVGRWWLFNLHQVFLVCWILAAIALLGQSLSHGFLAAPDMRVENFDPLSALLYWYQDRIEKIWPQGWIVSLPNFAYRGAMLLWALWVAASVIHWAKWLWGRLSLAPLWMKTKPSTPPV